MVSYDVTARLDDVSGTNGRTFAGTAWSETGWSRRKFRLRKLICKYINLFRRKCSHSNPIRPSALCNKYDLMTRNQLFAIYHKVIKPVIFFLSPDWSKHVTWRNQKLENIIWYYPAFKPFVQRSHVWFSLQVSFKNQRELNVVNRITISLNADRITFTFNSLEY